MDLLELWEQMGIPVKLLMLILAIMSMWSMGVFFERLFTFFQAGKQSKMFAPQAAKHLKDGRLKDAIAISQSKTYKYSHLGKVVLAGLQEYQFQRDSGTRLERDDLVDSVRRAIQRASALTAADLKKGMGVAGHHRRHRRVRRAACDHPGRHQRIPGYRGHRVWRSGRGVGRYLRGTCRDGGRVVRGDSGGVVLQLSDRADRVLQRRDGQLIVRARRLLHQEVGLAPGRSRESRRAEEADPCQCK